MTMAEVRIDMETSLYEQMAALCAKFGTTVEAMAVRFCEEFVRMGTPPVPEPYASMSVEDKIDFIAQNILREYNSRCRESLVREVLTRLLTYLLSRNPCAATCFRL